MTGLVFDTGALIALDRNDRRILVMMARARAHHLQITVPTTVLAQAIRDPRTQARVSRFIRDSTTRLVSLDALDATSVGIILASSNTTDIVDAHVVVCARRQKEPVVTSDADDLLRLDPTLEIVPI